MNTVTCPICEHQIELVPDGILKYCVCQCLGVDCTKEYTRYLGVLPLEDPNYSQLEEKKQETIKALKDIFQSKNLIGEDVKGHHG